MKTQNTFARIIVVVSLLMAGVSVRAADGDKVVYHIDNAAVQATKGLREPLNKSILLVETCQLYQS